MFTNSLIHQLFFSFIIPQGDDDGVCYASIMKTFLYTLEEDELDMHPDVPLFRQGRSKTASSPSTFMKQPVGKNYLINVGKDVASFLKLPEHSEYSTKSFLVEEVAPVSSMASMTYDYETHDKAGIKQEPMEPIETMEATTSQPLNNPLDEDDDMDLGNITSACTGVNEQTLRKYKRTWIEFKRIANVKKDTEPTKEDFATYLTIKGEGNSHGTLVTIYSHLNKMYKLIFKKQLSDYPELNKLLDSHIDADANAKKTSKRFTRQQLFQFLRDADDSNPQMLIRKVAAIMSFSGGISLQECRKLTMDSLKPCDNGYILKCENIMQRAHLHYGPTKLIPRYDEDGVSFARILDIYFESLTVDKVKTHGASPLIYSTRSFKNKGFQFCDSAMGKNTLIGLGKDIAAFLKLDEPELYTGLCFVQKNSKM